MYAMYSLQVHLPTAHSAWAEIDLSREFVRPMLRGNPVILHRRSRTADMERGRDKKEEKKKIQCERLRQKLSKQCRKLAKNHSKKSSNQVGTVPPQPSDKDSDATCVICLERYEGSPLDVSIGLIKECSHYYHLDCLMKWMTEQTNCPICRTKVKLSDEDIQGVPYLQILLNKDTTQTRCPSDAVSSDVAPETETVTSGSNTTIITVAEQGAAEESPHCPNKISFGRLGIRSLLSSMQVVESTSLCTGVILSVPQRYTHIV